MFFYFMYWIHLHLRIASKFFFYIVLHTFNSCFKKVFAACMRNVFPFAMLLYYVFLYTLLTIHYITFTYKYVNTRLEMSLYVSKYYYYILLIMKHEGKTQMLQFNFQNNFIPWELILDFIHLFLKSDSTSKVLKAHSMLNDYCCFISHLFFIFISHLSK